MGEAHDVRLCGSSWDKQWWDVFYSANNAHGAGDSEELPVRYLVLRVDTLAAKRQHTARSEDDPQPGGRRSVIAWARSVPR